MTLSTTSTHTFNFAFSKSQAGKAFPIKKVEMDYYAFGMPIQGRNYQSEKYRFGFNGKEMDTEVTGQTGVTYDYGFRIYDARIAKFLSVDPLTKEYPWNSTYAFAENDVIRCIDLEGLEKFISITITPENKEISYRGQLLSNITNKEVENFQISSNNTAINYFLPILTKASEDPKGIGFLAIFSHGVDGKVFGYGGFWNGIDNNDLDQLKESIKNRSITFRTGSIIYLGGCNVGTSCGTDENGNNISFAQKIADITKSDVIAIIDDQVMPKIESEKEGKMIYQPGHPKENNFYIFKYGQAPQLLGNEADVLKLYNDAKTNTMHNDDEMKTIPVPIPQIPYKQ